jgi:5-methylcytosine-specific restriction enzyme subunit McrC
MTIDKGILIKNVYYMLSYAFQVLKQSNYDEIASEEFDHIHDLFATILAKGIAQQLKQGLYREYIGKSNNLSVLRGKLNMQENIRNRLQRKQKLFCEYDELSTNNVLNQILKTTAHRLLQQPTVKTEHKAELRKRMLFFHDVDEIEPSNIHWNNLRYQRNNQSYRMLLHICYFILDGLLLSTEKGEYRMATFLDDTKMSQLFEKFVLEYYRYHHPELKASSSHIAWNIDEGIIEFLPIMKSDIMLKQGDSTLIIDTKYYSKTMQVHHQFDSHKIHSNNLYQIFTYVKNQDTNNTGNVAGMLLYAKTEEDITPDCEFVVREVKSALKRWI